MLFQQAKYYYPCSASVSGSSIVDSTGNKKLFIGALTYLYPFSLMSTVDVPAGYFSEGTNRFFNLHDVNHLKAIGTAVRLPGRVTVYNDNTVFGTHYIGTGIGGFDRLVSSSDQLYTSIVGAYGGVSTVGKYYFGIGIRIMGDIVIQAMGTPDMQGSKFYVGTYYFTAYQAQYVSGSRMRFRTYSYFQFSQRVSEVSPLRAIDNIVAHMLVNLNSAAWEFKDLSTLLVNSSSEVSAPDLGFINDGIFPGIDRNPNWNVLAAQAYNSVPFFSSNGIALGLDIVSLRSDIKATSELLLKLTKRSVAPSVIAKIFLAFYYGWRLLVSDLKGVSKAAFDSANLKSRNQKCSSHATWSVGGATYTAYFHCYYTRYANMSSKLDQFVSKFDLELNLGNIWDLIPFSFVVDWFVDLGSKLDTLDNYYQMTQEHKINCTGRSIKCNRRISTTQAGLTGWLGVIDVSYYSRSYTGNTFEPQFSLSSPQPLNHFVEGTALVVSRR